MRRLALGSVWFVAALLTASTAWAAGEGAPPTGQLVASIINAVLYFGTVIYLARKPVLAFFADRAAKLTASITEAAAAEAAAKEALAIAQAKTSGFAAEREATLSEFRSLGERERDGMVAAAHAQAKKLVEDARQVAAGEARLAQEALEQRLLDAALVRAEEELRSGLDSAAQMRWLERGIERVASGAAAPRH